MATKATMNRWGRDRLIQEIEANEKKMAEYKEQVSEVTARHIDDNGLDLCEDGLQAWAEELGVPVPDGRKTFDVTITIKDVRIKDGNLGGFSPNYSLGWNAENDIIVVLADLVDDGKISDDGLYGAFEVKVVEK